MPSSEGSHPTGPDLGTVPSIEIGSFITASPQNSEFIGSSSGVFFANTVFRAFAKSTPGETATRSDGPSVPDPGSILGCLGSLESSQEQVVAPIVLDPGVASDANRESATRSYGILAPGLGTAPPPALAKKLLMLYFQHWHPFFPILHGPTFFDEVNAFYQEDGNLDLNLTAEEGMKKRLCRAVTFQCVFNIVACTNSRHVLEPPNKIGSTSALMALLGLISSSNDIPSLQALLVAEIYLVVNMSLRKASTINGSVTRMIYHAGLHRCPFRYVALSPEVCDMRKRIFWSAYVLDRNISQLLGHPSSIQDSHVDLESKLTGFPQWWNGLPLAFQDMSEHDPFAAEPSYVAFFTMLYKYLIILANRPFLSLPTQRPDFQSSLQTAIGASCAIVQKLKGRADDMFLMAWPGTLPAVWTSGLIIAFASHLRLYPLAKAKLEIEHCLKLLDIMGSRWQSARHCHRALKRLLDQLSSQSTEGPSETGSRSPNLQSEDVFSSRSQAGNMSQEPGSRQGLTRGAKRKFNDEMGSRRGDQFQAVDPLPHISTGTLPFPVLEYNGPDFGFDATQLSGLGPPHNLASEPNSDAGGFYGNVGWDAFIQGLGIDSRFNI
ncbi:hypothetical protein SLS62_009389 [Diatrype stigma]|uniref:Xylanolytic transcriptional activator regulatory domain-containing protein n=1 Tax=Diatrype stigma TaxID=117547 RepID=A0AAN9YJL9_9PEZI